MKNNPLTYSLIHLFTFFLLVGCATTPKIFDVVVEVDFGPAQRPSVAKMVQVERGTTPQAATAQVFQLAKGAVCCDARETAGVDGVMADPGANRWWTVSVNGSKKVSPYKTKLKPGDRVRWEYRQYEQ